MKLILEGPDNAGKTTLANLVKESLGDRVTYFHPGGQPADFAAETACMLEQLRLISGPGHHIIDRITAISQEIYNPDPSWSILRTLNLHKLLDYNPIVLYCRPSTDKLLRTSEFTWRQEETEEHRQKIIANQHVFLARYDRMMMNIPCIIYDYEDHIGRGHLIDLLGKAFCGLKSAEEALYKLMKGL